MFRQSVKLFLHKINLLRLLCVEHNRGGPDLFKNHKFRIKSSSCSTHPHLLMNIHRKFSIFPFQSLYPVYYLFIIKSQADDLWDTTSQTGPRKFTLISLVVGLDAKGLWCLVSSLWSSPLKLYSIVGLNYHYNHFLLKCHNFRSYQV